jgi:tetratricopeptide (TPR) repeat protein
MVNNVIEIEADWIDEAKRLAQAQVPEGYAIAKMEILNAGKSQNIKATSTNIDEAYSIAERKIPPGYKIVKKQVINKPEKKKVTIEAFDLPSAEDLAKTKATNDYGASAYISNLRLITVGTKGFAGIGKKPNIYEVEIEQPATVEVSYQSKVKVRFGLLNTEEYFDRVKGLLKNGQFNDGINLLKQGWSALPRTEILVFLRGFDAWVTGPLDQNLDRLVRQGSFGNAMDVLEKLESWLATTPASAQIEPNDLNPLSTAYSRVGVRMSNIAGQSDSFSGIKKAISTFEQAISLAEKARATAIALGGVDEPLHPAYYQSISLMYLQAGRYPARLEKWQEAMPYFEKATQADPENDEAWLMLGYAHFPNVQESMPYWKRAAELGNEHAIKEINMWRR